MFGKNKINQGEIDRLRHIIDVDDCFFEQVEDQREMLNATISEIEESRRQVDSDVNQFGENVKNVAQLAEENAQTEDELTSQLRDYSQRAAEIQKTGEQVTTRLQKLMNDLTGLVDENKHFTTPSKMLSELPTNLRAQNQLTGEQLDRMEEYSKQMGVLALNAAIEAGHLGDSGRDFVQASEAVRSYTSNFEQAIEQVRRQLSDSANRITELEEQVHHLITLLKENNVTTGRLMKYCGETVRKAAGLKSGNPPEEELTGFVNRVTVLRNADEEIAKSAKRNQLQAEDLTEEFRSQQQNQEEVNGMMNSLFQHVDERKNER